MSADNLFRQLEPPRGGAERFARRLDESDAAPAAARWLPFALAGAASAAAVALVVALVLLREPSDDAVLPTVADSQPAPEIYDSPEFDRLLGRPLRPEQFTAVVNEQSASVTELESQNEKVRIYQIN
jgi:hypothetical protein